MSWTSTYNECFFNRNISNISSLLIPLDNVLTMPVKVQIEFHYHTKIQGSKNDKRKESDTFKDDSLMMKKYCVT